MANSENVIDRALALAKEESGKRHRDYKFEGVPDHVVLRIAQYGYKYQRFTIGELLEYGYVTVHEKPYVLTILNKSISHKSDNPHHIATRVDDNINVADIDNHVYTLLPSTVFSYIDHLELKLAQNNAKAARKQSTWAIILSVFAILVGLLDVFKDKLI